MPASELAWRYLWRAIVSVLFTVTSALAVGLLVIAVSPASGAPTIGDRLMVVGMGMLMALFATKIVSDGAWNEGDRRHG